MIANMDGVIADCERARRNLIDIQRVKKPIRVVPPLDRLGNVPKAVDREYRDVSTLRLAMFGRLEPNKGAEPLLCLWKHIDIGNAELHFYGVELDQSYRSLAQRLGLRNVVFHGSFERSDLPKLLDTVDIGLMLSFGEGYGLVVSEYMACGVPFVMTDVGAAEEFTRDNPDALRVACDNRAVKEGIEAMARRVRSGCTSRQRLQAFHQQNFSYEKAAALYVKALLEPQTFWV
jgi:glycosyltransferase involved in cell wall biosynthesis